MEDLYDSLNIHGKKFSWSVVSIDVSKANMLHAIPFEWRKIVMLYEFSIDVKGGTRTLNQFLSRKPLLIPSMVRFALVLVSAIALLLMATPGAFAASAHPSDQASRLSGAIPQDFSCNGRPCGYLLVNGQSNFTINPSSTCSVNKTGTYRCYVTLSFSTQYTNLTAHWVAGYTTLTGVHEYPSSGTLAANQAVPVRITFPSVSQSGYIRIGTVNNQSIISGWVWWTH